MVKPRLVIELSELSTHAKVTLQQFKVKRYRQDNSCILVMKKDTPLHKTILGLFMHGELNLELLSTFNYLGELQQT